MFGFLKKKKSTTKELASNPPPPLVEGEDFYLENGLYVFTEQYHLKRGYCCGSGCRHCAYKKNKGTDS